MWLVKRLLLWAILVVVCFAAGGALFIAQRANRSGRSWHAEVMVDVLDCSHGEVCHMHPSTNGRSSYGTEGKTFEWKTNRLGYRGPDRAATKAPGLLRLQVYGDSMIFGSGVGEGETLPDQLEAQLRRALPERVVEVQNFGMPMNYLRSNLIVYRDFGRAYSPDVVLFWLTGNWFNPKDMNHRLVQIHNSPVLEHIRRFDWGRWLINTWQVGTQDLFSRRRAIQDLRERFELLARDQKQSGTAVVLFSYWEEPDGIREVVPQGLHVAKLWAGLTMDQYREWAIPGDGHPTAEGQAHFARWLTDELLPQLRERPD